MTNDEIAAELAQCEAATPLPHAVLQRLEKFAATKELGTFTDLEVADLLKAHESLQQRLAEAERERDGATATCAGLRALAERLIKDVDGLEFYYYAKEDYERLGLEMRHDNGCNGPVVIKPGIGDAILAQVQSLEQRLAEAERERDGYSDQLEEVRKLFDGPPQFHSRMALLEQIRTIVCRSPLCDTPLSLENESLKQRLAEQAGVVASIESWCRDELADSGHHERYHSALECVLQIIKAEAALPAPPEA